MAQIPQSCLTRKMFNYVIANKRQQEKGFVEGNKGLIINTFKVRKGKNKRTGNAKLKMT